MSLPVRQSHGLGEAGLGRGKGKEESRAFISLSLNHVDIFGLNGPIYAQGVPPSLSGAPAQPITQYFHLLRRPQAVVFEP